MLAVALTLWVAAVGAVEIGTQQCRKINSCKCEMDDGSGIINLRSLAHPGNLPKWTLSGGDGWMYKYNPCLEYAMGRFSGLAVAQASTGGSVYDLGVQSTATFNVTVDGKVIIRYTADDGRRSAKVILECDRETRFDSLKFIGEMKITEYDMYLSSPCACPGYCDDFGLYESVAKNMSGYWEHHRGNRPPLPAPANEAEVVQVPQSPSYPWSDVGTSMVALLFHDVVLVLGIASCLVLSKHFKSVCGRHRHGGKCRYDIDLNRYYARENESTESSLVEEGDGSVSRPKDATYKVISELKNGRKCNGCSQHKIIGKPE